MELSLLLMKEIVQLFIILFIGFILVKGKILSERDSKVFSILVLYVCVPCALINAFSVKMDDSTLFGLGLAFLAAIIIHMIYIPFGKLLAKTFHFSDIEYITMIYSNSGNLIFPLVAAVLGPEWVIYSSGFMVTQTVLFWTHVKSVISREKSFDIKSIVTNVGIISVAVGLTIFLFQIQLPEIILNVSTKLGNMMGPLAMLVIGMLFGNMDLKKVFSIKRAYIVTFFRLIVFPIIAIVLFKFTPIHTLMENADQILLISTMATTAPAAATITQFAQLYDNEPNYASALNVITVIFSVITMPLMIMIYQLL
ncbi:MAG: AEC family transporter [Firmicutes bacterium]|nr:AEC family transporter [Bacillota bacterium]